MSTAARSHTSPRSWMAIRQGIPAGLYWGLAAFGLALPLLLWLLAAAGNVDPVFLPGPARVAERIQAWWDEGLLGEIGLHQPAPFEAGGFGTFGQHDFDVETIANFNDRGHRGANEHERIVGIA